MKTDEAKLNIRLLRDGKTGAYLSPTTTFRELYLFIFSTLFIVLEWPLFCPVQVNHLNSDTKTSLTNLYKHMQRDYAFIVSVSSCHMSMVQ